MFIAYMSFKSVSCQMRLENSHDENSDGRLVLSEAGRAGVGRGGSRQGYNPPSSEPWCTRESTWQPLLIRSNPEEQIANQGAPDRIGKIQRLNVELEILQTDHRFPYCTESSSQIDLRVNWDPGCV